MVRTAAQNPAAAPRPADCQFCTVTVRILKFCAACSKSPSSIFIAGLRNIGCTALGHSAPSIALTLMPHC